ncbi:MAG: hypothetical protein WC343_05290 [Bacilli bacterium]|jgi:hypothetical protein
MIFKICNSKRKKAANLSDDSIIIKSKKANKIFSVFHFKTKRTMKPILSAEIKENKEYYIRQLENENARLLGEHKIMERQIKRELATYLEPIQNIFSNIDFGNCSAQNFSYIKTQLETFLQGKDFKIFNPELLTMHNKDEVIVESFILDNDKSKDGLIEKVLSVGIKDKMGRVLLPARVRICKRSDN